MKQQQNLKRSQPSTSTSLRLPEGLHSILSGNTNTRSGPDHNCTNKVQHHNQKQWHERRQRKSHIKQHRHVAIQTEPTNDDADDGDRNNTDDINCDIGSLRDRQLLQHQSCQSSSRIWRFVTESVAYVWDVTNAWRIVGLCRAVLLATARFRMWFCYFFERVGYHWGQQQMVRDNRRQWTIDAPWMLVAHQNYAGLKLYLILWIKSNNKIALIIHMYVHFQCKTTRPRIRPIQCKTQFSTYWLHCNLHWPWRLCAERGRQFGCLEYRCSEFRCKHRLIGDHHIPSASRLWATTSFSRSRRCHATNTATRLAYFAVSIAPGCDWIETCWWAMEINANQLHAISPSMNIYGIVVRMAYGNANNLLCLSKYDWIPPRYMFIVIAIEFVLIRPTNGQTHPFESCFVDEYLTLLKTHVFALVEISLDCGRNCVIGRILGTCFLKIHVFFY